MKYLIIKGFLGMAKLCIWDRHLRARLDFHIMQWEREWDESVQEEFRLRKELKIVREELEKALRKIDALQDHKETVDGS
jgi:hypothetical protein